MIKYVLLYVALGQTPAQLGTYDNLGACQNAIRQIYWTQMVAPGAVLDKETRRRFNEAIDIEIKYNQKYQCQPTK